MAATRVRIEPPNQLPSAGLTPIKYKQWKVATKIFLQQTPEFREYYPGGKYPTWTPLEDNPHRIDDLNANDNVPQNTNRDEHLAQRRINLETFLGIIARYSDEGDFDDIMEKSSSLEWIFSLHERRYGIQKKGRYFNRIDSIRFDKTTMSDHHKFYTDLRACFKSNLRKEGDTIKYKNNLKLEQDEKISPTTECLIIYMALERIDPRLPTEIDRIFGHRMDESTTLMDMQTEIFSYIPRALASLDRDDTELNAYHMHADHLYQQQVQQPEQHQFAPPEPSVNAMYGRPYQPRFPYKPTPRTQMRSQYNPRIAAASTNRTNTRHCKLCQALDLPNSVFNSHTTNNCRKRAQLQQIELDEQTQDITTYQQYPDLYQQYNNGYIQHQQEEEQEQD